MSLVKILGENSRDAMRRARQELGADAVILSTRRVEAGFELIASTAEAVATMASNVAPSAHSGASPSARTVAPAASRAEGSFEAPARASDSAPRPFLEFARQRAQSIPAVHAGAASPPTVSENPAKNAPATKDKPADGTDLMSELRSMRSSLEAQLEAMKWNDVVRRTPIRSRLVERLLASGFSPVLARAVTSRFPDDCAESHSENWLASVIAANVRRATADVMIEQGGIYALVGPTGVGKTTTTAKLAARFVMKHGAQNIGLISTDSYRIGGQDQLRIYGRILGVPVHTVLDTEELQATLAAMRHKHLVLIDTVGMGQRDQRVAEHLALIGMPSIQRLLLLNAAAHGETLDDVVKAYSGPGADRRLDGCCITKLDEAVKPGTVLDTVIRHKLPVHFLSNGQRVPEDLHLPEVSYLVHSALKCRTSQTFRLSSGEASLLVVPDARTGGDHVGHH